MCFLINVKNTPVVTQVVPVPLDRCTTEDIKEAFMVQAQEQQMELMEIPEHTDLKQVRTPDVACVFTIIRVPV